MDLIVWFIDGKDGETTIASAVTELGTQALRAITFTEAPIYVIQLNNTPQEFLEQLPEGVVACLYTDGQLAELEPEINTVQ